MEQEAEPRQSRSRIVYKQQIIKRFRGQNNLRIRIMAIKTRMIGLTLEETRSDTFWALTFIPNESLCFEPRLMLTG